VFWNPSNLGTAEAINKIIAMRDNGQHVIKADDDFIVHHHGGWVDLMCEAIQRDKTIGIIGLKRRDCWERPYETSYEKASELIYLPQIAGERVIVVEKCNHIMGTCQLLSSDLLDKMGYLYQPNFYGYDDVMASHRSTVCGLKNVFLMGVDIEHIDKGDTPYQGWKERHSAEVTQQVIEMVKGYYDGTRSIYYNPYE
jgi:GT2 family glycosyltransferase